MRRIVVAMAVVLAACGACGGDGDQATPGATTIDTGQVVGTAPASTDPPPTVARTNPLGTEVRTALGNTVTVYAYQLVPMERGFPTPPAGTEYAAIDVGGCLTIAGNGPDPQYFDLVMPDSSRLRSTFGLKKPELRPTRLAVGECIRGWITYEVPSNSRPQAVVFNASSLVRWSIP